jgi:RNA polymerase sigma-70 factor, ECF subfamily
MAGPLVTGSATPDPRETFEALYRSTRTDLLRYLVRRCQDADEAADLLAETYLTAWRKLESIPDGEAARLWLFGVARHLLLRSARAHRVAEALVERLAGELNAAQATVAAGERGQDALRLALRALSEQDREIITLTAWEGLAPREIARVIGGNANVVRIRLHRARARLRKELGLAGDGMPRSVARAGE